MSYEDIWNAGYNVIPIGGKIPILPWKQWQEKVQPVEYIKSLSSHTGDWGVITGSVNNLFVVDCDNHEAGRRWHMFYNAISNVIVKTPRGYHFWYSCPHPDLMNKVRIAGEDFDIRAEGGYVKLPPSEGYEFVRGDIYETLNPPPEFVQYRRSNQNQYPKNNLWEYDNACRMDAMQYIRHIHAIAGQRGHADTYRAVAWMHDQGYDRGYASAMIREWNKTNASPPWTERELDHKINSVYGRGK